MRYDVGEKEIQMWVRVESDFLQFRKEGGVKRKNQEVI